MTRIIKLQLLVGLLLSGGALLAWAEEGRTHGGIIFVDEKTIAPSDLGGQVRAISNLLRKTVKWDCCFLQR